MRLAATAKSLYTRKLIKLLILVVLILPGQLLLSQDEVFKIGFNNTLLSDALLETAKHLDVKVAFDAQTTGKIAINKIVAGNTIEEFLKNLLSNTGFDYQFKHNQYLIFENNTEHNQDVSDYNELIGTVVDKETKESLPFATIYVPSQKIVLPATSNGSFYIKYEKSNTIRIVINYIGYYSLDTNVLCQASPCYCMLSLTNRAQSIDLVEVKEPRLEMVDFRNNVDFATTINPNKLNDLPSLAETDIFRALQLLPGISYSENSSELNIRGGSGDQNLVLYDGQTLYSLSHFYGLFSSINPSVVKDIQVFKGGYDSRYGERISGIVDITGKSGNQVKPVVYGSVNLISGNIAAEVPIGKKLTVIVAGRRSYADIYSTSLANSYFKKNNNPQNGNSVSTTPDFYFYDYNAKATYKISDKENVSIGVIGGKDYINNAYILSSDAYYDNRSDSSTRHNYGINASWTKQWSGAFYSSVQVGASGYTSENYGNSLSTEMSNGGHGIMPYPGINFFQNEYNTNTLSDVSFAVKNIWYLNNRNQLDFGVLERQNKVSYHNDVDTNLFVGPVLLRDSIKRSAIVSSFYLQDRISITEKLSIKPGFRINYYSGNSNFYLEPRFSIGYKINDKLSVRFATGKFYQFIGQALSLEETGYNKYFWLLADDSIRPVMQSNHYVIGTTYEAGCFLFDIEAYYKNISGIQEYIQMAAYNSKVNFPQSPFRQSQSQQVSKYFATDSFPLQMQGPDTSKGTLKPSYFFTGSGKSYGIDFSVRYRYKNFTSWLAYSLSKSVNTYPQLNYGQETYAPTDQTHQFSLANMFTYGKWNFGAITLFNTGRPKIESAIKVNNLPVVRNYTRLPNYFRCDVSANYNFNIKNVKIKTGVTIINITNTQNTYDINTRENRFGSYTQDRETVIIQAQDLSFNLFLHFFF